MWHPFRLWTIRMRKAKALISMKGGGRSASVSFRKFEAAHYSKWRGMFTPLLLHVVSCCVCMLIGHRFAVLFKGHVRVSPGDLLPELSESSMPHRGYELQESYPVAIRKRLLYLEKMRKKDGYSWLAGNAAGGGINGTVVSRAGRHGILIRKNPRPNPSESILSQHLLLALQEYQKLIHSSVPNPRSLLVVTPTFLRTFQRLHMTNLINSLKSVTVPLLWIVVEYGKATDETESILSSSGLSYIHLHYPSSLSTLKWHSRMQVEARMRELGLNYIREHWLKGIVIFADDSSVFDRSFFEEAQKVKYFAALPVGILLQAGFEKQFAFLKKTPNSSSTSSHSEVKSKSIRRRLSSSSQISSDVTHSNRAEFESSDDTPEAVLQSGSTRLNRRILQLRSADATSLDSLQPHVSVQSPVCSKNHSLIGWHTVPHTPDEVSHGILGYGLNDTDGLAERAQMVWTGFIFDSRLIWKSTENTKPPSANWFTKTRVERSLLDKGSNLETEEATKWKRPSWVRHWDDWVGDFRNLNVEAEESLKLENEGLINRMIIDEKYIEPLGDCGKKIMTWWVRIEARGDSKHPQGWNIDPKLPITVSSKRTPWNFKAANRTNRSNSTHRIKSNSTSN